MGTESEEEPGNRSSRRDVLNVCAGFRLASLSILYVRRSLISLRSKPRNVSAAYTGKSAKRRKLAGRRHSPKDPVKTPAEEQLSACGVSLLFSSESGCTEKGSSNLGSSYEGKPTHQ